MGEVLFCSQNELGRCENLMAVWDAYDGPKTFRHGQDNMRSAERDGFSVVVCDALPAFIEGKHRCKSINIGHGINGTKLYGTDEKWKPWFDLSAAQQTDYFVTSSVANIPIAARQFGIPESHVLPLGFPRTDAYFRNGMVFETFKGRRMKRMYLYAPTFRYDDDGWIPNIIWGKVDQLLDDDEVLVVKRHYYTGAPLAHGKSFEHIVEVPPSEPSETYLRNCDVLLTDYSSMLVDAYLLGKPVVLACDDMRTYLDKRGMYHEYPDFYSSLWLGVEGHEELLVDVLRNAAANGMNETARTCVETLAGACDGHSAERVCDLIRSIA